MYGCFGRQVNGVDQLTFTQKDLTNAVAEEEKKRLELTEGDANGMIEYFNKMSADNQNFFHLCRFGKDGSLQDVVWVDARSRAAYEEFGDVVCFDSTYLTNKFHLPFAVFLGVNHHRQSILFGFALISLERAETYEWVMRTWLHCMGGKDPTTILTNQDPAIRKAVHCTMAETTHRWCIWHILQKFGLYEERVMWIPAYLKHLFWSGMKTTQRSESFNHFSKGYVDKHTTLSQFVIRYCDAMTVRAGAERMADSNTQRYVRHLVTDFPAEVLFQKCYTDAKFKEVQGLCKKMLYVRPLDHYEIGTNLIKFIIEDRVWIKPKNAKKDEVTKIRRCYRCHGIIFRHMILVYDLNGVTVVPEKYVLRRWRKDVQRKHTRVKVAYHDPLTTDEVRNYHNLMGTYEPICSKASICKEAVQAVKEMLHLMDLRVDEVLAMVAKRQLAGGNENGPGEDEGVHGVVRTPSSVAQNKGPEETNTPMTVAS
ncbi:protein FAR-RED IMPAIRED RESPONSE 1-like [Chenopodium quinoa]|uniref:protein FAR-RED IMPAIRED RESPONSE 1-like n=1 Tax=Chenopodium quinoa TaxID=63459 RepID=UPI000B775F18|nr:protein FAR-RED IMPAIRED RESPONSE 1-like [Chenopodium quinoa]